MNIDFSSKNIHPIVLIIHNDLKVYLVLMKSDFKMNYWYVPGFLPSFFTYHHRLEFVVGYHLQFHYHNLQHPLILLPNDLKWSKDLFGDANIFEPNIVYTIPWPKSNWWSITLYAICPFFCTMSAIKVWKIAQTD